jgi:hypothetical protein
MSSSQLIFFRGVGQPPTSSNSMGVGRVEPPYASQKVSDAVLGERWRSTSARQNVCVCLCLFSSAGFKTRYIYNCIYIYHSCSPEIGWLMPILIRWPNICPKALEKPNALEKKTWASSIEMTILQITTWHCRSLYLGISRTKSKNKIMFLKEPFWVRGGCCKTDPSSSVIIGCGCNPLDGWTNKLGNIRCKGASFHTNAPQADTVKVHCMHIRTYNLYMTRGMETLHKS